MEDISFGNRLLQAVAEQRNEALNDAAQHRAQVAALEAKLAERDAEIASLKADKPARRSRKGSAS